MSKGANIDKAMKSFLLYGSSHLSNAPPGSAERGATRFCVKKEGGCPDMGWRMRGDPDCESPHYKNLRFSEGQGSDYNLNSDEIFYFDNEIFKHCMIMNTDEDIFDAEDANASEWYGCIYSGGNSGGR